MSLSASPVPQTGVPDVRHSTFESLHLGRNSVIHGFISTGRANHYMPSLKVGSIVKVGRFEVARALTLPKKQLESLSVSSLIHSAENRERNSIADTANEEGQDTFVSSLCPLVGIVDIHRGHELTDQLRVENLWVSGQVTYAQLYEQVVEVRFDAQSPDHVWVNKPRWLDGDLQPLIVEYAVIVVPHVLDRTVSTCRALRRFVCVVKVVKERDRFVFALEWPRVLVANRWWWRSCATSAYVEPSLRPPFIHLQPITINEYRNSVQFDGLEQYRSTELVDVDRCFGVTIDR
ncbi:hypothetical protein F2Q69_00054916 [Brassica cretica]|uniref:Uncharacterized protein n=1 Tax=Brassica cretica TaxID=69181 RepID=A0A8S9MZ13_BRACR|nr:hypothetical protein F2Q69_00054916 [Brassica cretica]